ncbi:nuclear autoantigen Sp-100 isoform X4 [Loxodonta africana]|uniref:nuclear autoantigen Sp-100 isoform X4 n=1 Tax=Loxodonta africana TaxID=9785 RepID=UPI000C810B23|nr:nuclear autoantigen Sp-100 isoform X3 [Loxodonta africana]
MMAGRGSHLSTRMSIDNIVNETIFSHYRKHKVEMANAIKKPFPFLEGLRDRGFISDKLYEDSEESCRNLVPIQKVVYNVLKELEKTFDLPLLGALFSEVNKKEYPDLTHICRGFEDVIKEKLHLQEHEKEMPNIQPSLEQGTGENFLQSLPWLRTDSSSRVDTTPPEKRLSERFSEIEKINAKREDPTSDKNNAPESPQAKERCAQESEPSGSSEQVAIQVNNGDARQEVPSPLPSNEEGAELSTRGVQTNSCSVHLVDIKKEKTFHYQGVQASTNRAQASDVIVISSEDSEESNEEGEPLEAYTSAPTNLPELSEGEEPQEATCSQFLMTPGTPERRDFRESPVFGKSSRKRDSGQIGNKPICEKRSRIRRISDDSVELSNGEELQEDSSNGSGSVRGRPRNHLAQRSRVLLKKGQVRGIKGINNAPLKIRRKRGPNIPRDKNVDFRSSELPVTCGKVKGILYTEKLKQGSSSLCIQTEDGRWLTLRQFEIEGNHEKSKNWKTSVRCGGETLLSLIKGGFLQDPPRTRKRRRLEFSNNDLSDHYALLQIQGSSSSGTPPRALSSTMGRLWPRKQTAVISQPENSNHCEVCQDGGYLFCCDTCPKSFHEDCHIQLVEAERDPWSCIFCKIKAIQNRCPENQPCHQESEILKRQMLPEEKLKCEFLLLKVYCWAKSTFFANEPHYSRQSSQGPREPMWLNKIKERLKQQHYHQVDEFVQDMRLIFQNHKAYYRDHKFARLGLQLKAIFEKNFKDIFAIQETTNKSSFQFGPIFLL